MNNKLIYGKNEITNIVNIEINEDKAIVFQEVNGKITTSIYPNKFWILSDKPHNSSWHRLKGDLHYKWGKQFTKRADFYKVNNSLYNDNFVIYDSKEAIMVKDGYTYYKGMNPSDVSVLSFDIESTGLYHNNESQVLLISNTYRSQNKTIEKLFAYDEFESQAHMIQAWCDWVRSVNPSLIIGHNIYSYDLPYLNFIAEREGLPGLQLGRDNTLLKIFGKPSKFRIDGSREQEYHKVRCYGRDIIDTMFLSIKYDVASKKYESYGLKSIIKTEGLERQDRVHYDSSKIRFNYKIKDEWEKIKEYCRHDSEDALKIFDLMCPAFFYMTQIIPKSFQQVIESATGSQINAIMLRSYLQEGHSIPQKSSSKKYEGAISFGNPGIYRNVYKVDITSLYPSIILQCNVFDEDKDPNKNFLNLVQILTEERIKNKRLAKTSKYHDDLQNAQKITINSCYGFLGTEGLHFNSPDAAEFITKTGREILQTALLWAEQNDFIVPNADTDSITFGYKDQRDMSIQLRQELLEKLNSRFPNKIRFEDDGYFKTLIIVAAKNYVLDDGKKIKIKGSALKSPQKEKALQEFIKEILDAILKNENINYKDIYNKYIKEINNITDIKRWAARKTISDKTLNSERSNEQVIKKAIEGSEYVEGDRIYCFYKNEKELCLVENFNGEYDKERLYGKLYDTAQVFETILPTEELFINYKLKKNKQKLIELLTTL